MLTGVFCLFLRSLSSTLSEIGHGSYKLIAANFIGGLFLNFGAHKNIPKSLPQQNTEYRKSLRKTSTGNMSKSRTPGELRALLAAFGQSLNSNIPVSCTGEVHDEDEKFLFDYHQFQNYRNLKSRCGLLERYIQIKSGKGALLPNNYTDEELRKDFRTEYGPLDITCGDYYDRIFETYKKARRHQLKGWLEKEKVLETKRCAEIYEEMLKTTKNEISFVLRNYPAFEDLKNELLFQKLDWFRLPRVNYLRIDPVSPYAIEAKSEGWTVSKIKRNESQVALLPPKEGKTLIKNNLHLCDLSSAFPSLIISPGVSEDQAKKLKFIILKFPHGVVFSKYLEKYEKLFGKGFKPKEETFMKMCEDLPDIFLVVEGIDPEKKLIFPAFWRGIIKPTLYLRTKLWHWVKFIINNNRGLIDTSLVIPRIKYFFNLEIRPKDWGFVCDEHFLHFLMNKVSPQPTYSMYKEKGTGKKGGKFIISSIDFKDKIIKGLPRPKEDQKEKEREKSQQPAQEYEYERNQFDR